MEITNIFKNEWKSLFDIPDGTILRCHPLHQVYPNSLEPEYYECGISQKPCPDCGIQMIFRPYFLVTEDDKGIVNTGIFTSFCDCYKKRNPLTQKQFTKKKKLTEEEQFLIDVRQKRIELQIKKQKEDYEDKVNRAAFKELNNNKIDSLPY